MGVAADRVDIPSAVISPVDTEDSVFRYLPTGCKVGMERPMRLGLDAPQSHEELNRCAAGRYTSVRGGFRAHEERGHEKVSVVGSHSSELNRRVCRWFTRLEGTRLLQGVRIVYICDLFQVYVIKP
jgi:hypothetical protein